ncbi:type 2 periplasmic-binding domain-containing protein [Marinobacterium lutimaris]|uniref:Amino acid ABC transporter substrate-binding protein, PAAT family n=1 Tax=Marinobacterium lutimaris TaxID=568106 RepID=A0A1H6CZP2_9GAMM|nr:transporter substrate-binding domain-containing protein [Marinobacterium lutimaris]SEG78639.1 amino acid ABC transporter substrate-binding protein, PAAT family [Marinobacterium lutimaris]
MRILSALLISLALLLPRPAWSADQTTLVRYATDGLIDYPLALLEKSLQASEEKYGPYRLQRSDMSPSQGRVRQLVTDGALLDVMFVMSSEEVESEMLVVPFPLMRGLLGYRVMMTTPENLAALEAVKSLEDLQPYVAIQGGDWADTDILRANQLSVITTSDMVSMMRMLKAGRVDYFPRGVAEIWEELKLPLAEGLVANKKVVLRYTGPYYIAVSKRRPLLQERILYGLMQLHESGEFERFLRQRPEMSRALSFLEHSDYQIIDLTSPFTLPSIQKVPSELWYQPALEKSR